ncbi:hypothetical protein FGO68_gene16292 [Halteria grandinella]|uniref:MORN repeat-containing protein n=1 Tax=Halteria grandinella TaxID=5974 RepID=A0A8J8NU04_HALGN|nr:hypothetical protein FGO68_gene16292 [Halteria grandinella]
MHGWNWTLDQLNAEAVEWTTFDKVERDGFPALQEGVYYGQMLDGLRNGLGMVYCTTNDSSFWLFECEWKRGIPVHNGRYTNTTQSGSKWHSHSGTMGTHFMLTGVGTMKNQEGHSYKGKFKRGQFNGKGGEYRWPKGVSYKGEFVDGQKHGLGLMTFADGSTQKGEWDSDVQVKVVEEKKKNRYVHEGIDIMELLRKQ